MPTLTVNMLDAKTRLSKLVEAVESGTESEIIIARNGKPAARIVPLETQSTRAPRKLGLGNEEFGSFDYEAFQALDKVIWKGFYEDETSWDPPATAAKRQKAK
jgi:prevent-host-death family protein